MLNPESIGGLVHKAFDLACFIQRDRDAAVRIVARALTKLEVATTAQGKRLYYKPSGRPWSLRSQSGGLRNRISFNELHLLQRLIYIESEPYEIAQEQRTGSNAAGEEDLVIHFIKHLVRKTTKRNSFYVTLGLSRLLHSYTTAETMDIYNAVIQDPERVKDDYYFRSRKAALMQELKLRFGDLIKVCHGPRGEEKFETDDNPTRFVKLVRECLSFFTPWNTPCLVPAGIDPIREGIPSFSDRSHKKEDETEVNRIHAILHPECFHRLIEDLRFESPNTRLNVPHFFYGHDVNSNGSNRHKHSATLSEEELRSIKREVDGNATRRKSAHAGVLRVIVDGNECARFDPRETRSTRFHLESDAELIEVLSDCNDGEEVVLALHPLAYAETDDKVQPAHTSITLEGGQKISIVVSPATQGTDATVDISYRETNPARAASLLFNQLVRLKSDGSSRIIWNGRRILVPTLAVFLLGIGLVAIIKFARNENAPAVPQDQVATSRQHDTVTKELPPPTESSARDSNKSLEKASGQQRRVVGPSAKTEMEARNSSQPRLETPQETGTEASQETRSLKAPLAVVPLSAVKKIYVEVLGDDISKQSMRKALVEGFGKRIIIASNRNEADALLEVSITKPAGAEPHTIDVVVELLNARGDVIWPNTSSKNYQGSARAVTNKIVRDLLADMKKSK